MQDIFYELSILKKVVQYPNLVGASLHIGLGQPQLSRIVKKVEMQLGITLLDRSSKRKSGWTPIAYSLFQSYSLFVDLLQNDVQKIIRQSIPTSIKIGLLEGTGKLACSLANKIFADFPKIKLIELEVQDLDKLHELYLKGHYHITFTCSFPDHEKTDYIKSLGFQKMEFKKTGKDTYVFSSFEYATTKNTHDLANQVFISNSLELRRHWLQKYKGRGVLPSILRKPSPFDEMDREIELFLLGHHKIGSKLWDQIERIDFDE